MAETNDSVTLWIAIYGALVSTAVFLWNVRLGLRDSSRLLISIVFEPYSTNELGERIIYKEIVPSPRNTKLPPLVQLRVHVTNVGRRPVALRRWYLYSKKLGNPAIYSHDSRPTIKLQEGEGTDFVADDLKQWLGSADGLAVEDLAGKAWKLSKSEFNYAKSHIDQLLLDRRTNEFDPISARD
jgi:hypothetical protein